MTKVALLIGVSEYEPGLNPLPGAVKDVEALQEVLLNPELGGFEKTDVILLKNPERQDVEEAIERLFTYRQKDDLVLLYFSGHGIKDDLGRLYLATRRTRKNSNGELVRATAIAANFVQQCMGLSRSRRQVVILDSCFSGAFAEGLSAKDDGTVDIREQLGGEGRVVLTSSSSTQYSFEEQGQDLSIYTRFLIEGIRSGEADRDEDEFISIDELHEYASQKVREFQPAMKPEIYAVREGFKIRLAKVAPGDPSQKYRKEVRRFIHRGEISFVGRRTLDVLATRLGLGATAARAIEDEVLEPCRQEFHDKLQQYGQVFSDLLGRDETITEGDRHDLQNLQQLLGLRNEDTIPIEAEVTARFKAHQQNLQAYKQSFSDVLRQEYPLSDATRLRFRKMRQQFKLSDDEIAPIEAKITAEVEVYRQQLERYEQVFAAAIQQEYPLSEAKQNELQRQQQDLGLSEVDVAPIEARITAQIETYHQKLQQYEQAFVNATERKHFPDEVSRNKLQQTWQTLGLSQEDVRAIEGQIIAEINAHQTNLQQYEQEFINATQQQYPLSERSIHELQRRQQALELSDEDVNAIKNHVTTDIEEHLQKIQQYEQVLTESIQYEYPLTDETREELKRFQHILELSDETATQIEEQIIGTKGTISNSDPVSSTLDKSKSLIATEDYTKHVAPLLEQQDFSQITEVDEWNEQSSQVSIPPPLVPSQYRRENTTQSRAEVHLSALYQERKDRSFFPKTTEARETQRSVSEWKFWFQWTLATTGGLFVGVFSGFIAGAIMYTAAGGVAVAGHVAILFATSTGGFIVGLSTGLGQQIVFRIQKINSRQWAIKSAMIGAASAALITLVTNGINVYGSSNPWGGGWTGAVLGTITTTIVEAIMTRRLKKLSRTI
jgi:Caspase domain